MGETWGDECHENKDHDKCIINIFCNCDDDKKPDDKTNDCKCYTKKNKGKCIINIFCNCNGEKKDDDKYNNQLDSGCDEGCQCGDEGKW